MNVKMSWWLAMWLWVVTRTFPVFRRKTIKNGKYYGRMRILWIEVSDQSPYPEGTLYHERIHAAQMLSMGIIPYIFLYGMSPKYRFRAEAQAFAGSYVKGRPFSHCVHAMRSDTYDFGNEKKTVKEIQNAILRFIE